VNVSEDLLKLWANSQKLPFEKVKGRYFPYREEACEGGILVTFASPQNAPQATFVVNWNQISNIIQEVEQTGQKHVVGDQKVTYLKREIRDSSQTP